MTDPQPIETAEDRRCERCGRFGVIPTDGPALCADCHELAGSCCPEFGGDDLTISARDCGRAGTH